ncbi:hypothetical protein [Salidesulfovibrio onnuriiensis]|uniref:hypothetical protein n=1 Tax=Salidesulfovibrio onnuriiensis TaxID=2583823 RepID=UPI0011C7680B|nr:hypothetical protein [Salidesulfovibrio onnuriiensis]
MSEEISPVEEHGINIFPYLDANAVYHVADQPVNGQRLKNDVLALALIRATPETREVVLRGLNVIRRERVREMLAAYEAIGLEDMRQIEPAVDRAVENILMTVQYQMVRERVFLGDGPDPEQNPLLERPLPHCNIAHYSPEGLLGFWVFLAFKYRHRFNPIIDEAIEAIEDGFSAGVLALASDDLDDTRFMVEAEILQREMTGHHADMLELVRRAVLGICRGAGLEEILNSLCDTTPLLFLEKDRLPNLAAELTAFRGTLLTEELHLAAELYKLAMLVDEGGLAALTPYVPNMEDAYLGAGLELVVQGFGPDVLVEVMTRRKQTLMHEMDIKTQMVLRSCLCLREGSSPRELNELVGAFLPRPLDYEALLKALIQEL